MEAFPFIVGKIKDSHRDMLILRTSATFTNGGMPPKKRLVSIVSGLYKHSIKSLNMKKTGIIVLLVGLLPLGLVAQEVSGGFKVGLNFSRFEGPSAEGPQGEALEMNDFATNFHVGALVNFSVTDLFGFRTEILYSQKGSQYSYDGPSYLRLYTQQGNPVVSFGNRREVITFSNSYLDVPLMTYVRLGRVEASAGVNAALLIGSRGQGEITFSGVSAGGQNVDPIILTVDGNYTGDDPSITGIGQIDRRTIDNQEVLVPEIVNAYYDGNQVDEILFNRLDFGLNAGLNVYVNNGLNLGFRLNYGLTDITNQQQDVNLQMLDGNELILNDDDDRNVSLQASIGFSF